MIDFPILRLHLLFQVLQNLMSTLNPSERQTRSTDSDQPSLGFESIVGSLVPMLMQQGHEHHDEPELEDVHAHEQFEQATSMFKPILAQVKPTHYLYC